MIAANENKKLWRASNLVQCIQYQYQYQHPSMIMGNYGDSALN
jgi:hypothetical protein